MGDEDLRERMARVETKQDALEEAHKDLLHSHRELIRRFNRFIMTMLAMLGSAVLGLFGWLVRKVGG